ncbi:MAG: outer membrane beta-barrel protein [Deltaproteobacteria bacterium]|nr:outer membrane beta-barrel protein [Deltaproteobacteria bacterium]
MQLIKRYFPVILAVGISGLCPVAHALEFEPGIGAGLAYTDNADLVHDNEEDDIVAIGYLGARLSEDSGPLRFDASSAITYQKYLDDTVGDQTYFTLGSSAEWEQIRGRLYWNASDFFTQRKEDSLEAGRASNLQNTNVFTLGPSMRFRPSEAHSVNVNSQYANWLYQMRPTLQTGLDGGVNAVYYNDEHRNPNTVSSNLHAVLSGTGPHSSYTVNLGATHVSRDRFDSTSGFTGDVAWLRELTGHSSLRLYLASQLTNASDNLLDSQTNPDDGSFGNEQINGDVVRNSTMTIVYRRTDDTFNTTIRAEVRDFDYKESPDDRRTYQLGADLNYKVSPLVDGGLNVSYRHLEKDDTNRTDKEYRIVGNINYHLSRNLRSAFAVRYQNKSSDVKLDEYNETAVFIGLIWGHGSVPHTGIL